MHFNSRYKLYSPLTKVRGVKGAAAAACDEIVAVLLAVGRPAGVKEGDSTLSFFELIKGKSAWVLQAIE